jgi:hypothetical protein
MLTTAYVLVVLAHALAPPDRPIVLTQTPPRSSSLAALALALCSLLLGVVPWEPYLPIPYSALSKLLGIGGFFKLLATVLGGAALAVLLSPWPHPMAFSAAWKTMMSLITPFRRACLGSAAWSKEAITLFVNGLYRESPSSSWRCCSSP